MRLNDIVVLLTYQILTLMANKLQASGVVVVCRGHAETHRDTKYQWPGKSGFEGLGDPNALLAMQVALLFEVSCRESEIGHADDSAEHQRYHANSMKAFQEYYTDTTRFSEARDAAVLEQMRFAHRALGILFQELDPTDERCGSPHVNGMKYVLEVCHDVELIRCVDATYYKARFWGNPRTHALSKSVISQYLLLSH